MKTCEVCNAPIKENTKRKYCGSVRVIDSCAYEVYRIQKRKVENARRKKEREKKLIEVEIIPEKIVCYPSPLTPRELHMQAIRNHNRKAKWN